MAQQFSHVWTGTNGDPWPNFTRVAGGTTYAPEILNNQGAGPDVEMAEVFMQSDFWPQTTNIKPKVWAVWKAPATAGDSFRFCARLTDDGAKCYFAEIYSNKPGGALGSPTVRFYRRRSSTNTQLGSDVDISGDVASGDLATGVTFQFRLENLATGVSLKVFADVGAGFVEVASYTDTAAPIWSGGTVGIGLTSTWRQDDILLDNLVCEDFEDEMPAGYDLSDGLGMIINGAYYDKTALNAMGILDVEGRQSYTAGPSIRIVDSRDFHDPVFNGGEEVTVLYGTAPIAYGVVRDRSHAGAAPEGSQYTLRSPKELARGVSLKHPTTTSPTITFNLPADNEYYDAALAGMNLKQIAEYVYDNHLEGQDGLRAHKAAPSSGTAYTIPAAFANIGHEALVGFTVSGDFVQAIEQILFFARTYGWYIDPDTRQHAFHKRDTAALVGIDAQDTHGTPRFNKRPSVNKTCVIIHGGKPETTFETMSLSAGTLQEAWDKTAGGLDDSGVYDPKKRNKNSDRATITAAGYDGGVGKVYVDLDTSASADFKMEAGEWRRAYFNMGAGTGPELGNQYYVYENSTTRVWLDRGSWQSGSAPTVGGTVTLTGGSLDDPDARGNAYNEMYRVYEPTDPAKRALAKGECVQVRVTTPTGGSTASGDAVQPAGATFHNVTGKIELDEPALLPIGVTKRFASKAGAGCGTNPVGGIDGTIGDIEVDVPVANDEVPYLRVPTTGFRGTAYSKDSSKWNGAGEHEPGVDDGVMDPLVIHDPGYQFPSVQDADYIAFADEALAALGTLSVEAEIVLADVIDERFFGLNKRITYSDTGERTTGYETAADLWVMEVRWNFAKHQTTILCGTQGSFRGLDIESLRKVYTENARIKAFREQLEALRKMKDCLNQLAGLNGGQVSKQSAGAQICSENTAYTSVSSHKHTEETTTIKDKLDGVQDILDAILGLLEWQKGGLFSIDDTDGDGVPELWWQGLDGTWWDYDPATGLWDDGPGGSAPIPIPGEMENGGDGPTDMPGAGVEGTMWATIQMILDLLETQKGGSFVLGNDSGFGTPGWTNTNGDTFWYDPDTDSWAQDGGDGEPGGGPSGGGGDDDTPVAGGPLDPGDDGEPEGLGGLEGDQNANKHALEAKVAGLVSAPDDSAGADVVTDVQGNLYQPIWDEGGVVGYAISPDSPGGHPGPATGGLLGNVAGGRGMTEDGAALDGPGPGSVWAPGKVLSGAETGYYYPPDEADGETAPHELAAGDTVPETSAKLQQDLFRQAGLDVFDLNDPRGIVWTSDGGTTFYIADSTTTDPSTGSILREAVTASGGPGTGENGGDYVWQSPSAWFNPSGGGTPAAAVFFDNTGGTALPGTVTLNATMANNATSNLTLNAGGWINIADDGDYLLRYSVAAQENLGGAGLPFNLRGIIQTSPTGLGTWTNVAGGEGYAELSGTTGGVTSAIGEVMIVVSGGGGLDVQIGANLLGGPSPVTYPNGSRLTVQKVG